MMSRNPFENANEFEKLFGLERLKITIEKAETSFETLEPETIDYCKCIIEAVCKHILDDKGLVYDGMYLPKLIRETLTSLHFPNDQVRGGISSIISGIAEIRNQTGIAGHGLHGQVPVPTKNDVKIFVSIFGGLMDILWHCFEDDEIDVRHTKINFQALENKLDLYLLNQITDGAVSVEYSQEEGIILIEGKEIRPSEILYLFDREAYAQRIIQMQTKREEEFREEIESELIDELGNNRFDNFHPGHYGYEYPEIWFDPFVFEKDKVLVTGMVYTSVRLGSSKKEDGFDLDYSSAFQAIFSLFEDPKEDEREITLESLELEKNDWILPE